MYKCCMYILCNFGCIDLGYFILKIKMLISKYISIKNVMSQMFGVIFILIQL